MTQVFLGFLVLITVALNTIAQTLLKLGAEKTPLNFYLIGGIAAYGFSTLFYIGVLGKFNLSTAYPIVIGLTIATTTIVGAALLHEKVGLTQWIGIGLMISGIGAIAFGKGFSTH